MISNQKIFNILFEQEEGNNKEAPEKNVAEKFARDIEKLIKSKI